MSDFEKDQVMQNRDLRILAANSALVNYQEFLPEEKSEIKGEINEISNP